MRGERRVTRGKKEGWADVKAPGKLAYNFFGSEFPSSETRLMYTSLLILHNRDAYYKTTSPIISELKGDAD